MSPRALGAFDDVLEVHALTTARGKNLVRLGVLEPRVLWQVPGENRVGRDLGTVKHRPYPIHIPPDRDGVRHGRPGTRPTLYFGPATPSLPTLNLFLKFKIFYDLNEKPMVFKLYQLP